MTAQQIAEIDLPSDFEYIYWYDAQGYKTVKASSAKEGLSMTLHLIPSTVKATDSKTLVEEALREKQHAPPTFTEEQRGTMDVAGESMFYIVEKVKGNFGITVAEMAAGLVTGKNKKIVVEGYSRPPFNLKGTQRFLASIKSWR